VVRFTHYPWDKNTQYPLDRRLGGSQSWSVYDGEEKNSLPLPGMKPWLSNP